MRRAGQRGVTLIELMIAVVISGIAISAALAMAFSLMGAYREHRIITMVERSARASLDIMADAVRGASPAVPDGNIEDLVGCSGAGAGLRVTNYDDQPDELELIYASGGVITSLQEDWLADDASLLVVEAGTLKAGDYIVVSNITQGHLIAITGVEPDGDYDRITTAASPTDSCAALVNFPMTGYQEGTLVIRAKIAHFYVDDDPDVYGGIPTLVMDTDGDGAAEPEPLAQGIEDLQIAVGADADDDGTVSDTGDATDNWFFNDPGNDPLDDIVPSLTTTPWRAIRISVVARALEEISGSATDSVRPALEDHAGLTAQDKLRRRVLSTTVELRNLTGSP